MNDGTMNEGMKDESIADAAPPSSEPESAEPTPLVIESGEALVTAVPLDEEPTVGTGSYIGVGCAIAMLVLTVILIGVVFLLRWIG